jgi:hypothetical protein
MWHTRKLQFSQFYLDFIQVLELLLATILYRHRKIFACQFGRPPKKLFLDLQYENFLHCLCTYLVCLLW